MILSFDTSGATCSAALSAAEDPATPVAERVVAVGSGHAEHLPLMIADLLAAQALPPGRVRRVIATCGPGSFTGLRVAIAAARALALALDIVPEGVTALAALAQAAWRRGSRAQRLLAAVDGGRGGVYAQLFALDGGQPRPLDEALALSAALLPERMAGCDAAAGSAARACPAFAGLNRACGLAGVDDPLARDLPAAAAWAGMALAPVYLRAPNVRAPAPRFATAVRP